MAPVDPLSLVPVLDLIERWQQADGLLWKTAVNGQTNRALANVDIPALRALAEQHAAQLRALATTPFDEECNTMAAHRCADWLVGEEK